MKAVDLEQIFCQIEKREAEIWERMREVYRRAMYMSRGVRIDLHLDLKDGTLFETIHVGNAWFSGEGVDHMVICSVNGFDIFEVFADEFVYFPEDWYPEIQRLEEFKKWAVDNPDKLISGDSSILHPRDYISFDPARGPQYCKECGDVLFNDVVDDWVCYSWSRTLDKMRREMGVV